MSLPESDLNKWWGMFYLTLYCLFFAESFNRSNQ
jgi:hypothetical protein